MFQTSAGRGLSTTDAAMASWRDRSSATSSATGRAPRSLTCRAVHSGPGAPSIRPVTVSLAAPAMWASTSCTVQTGVPGTAVASCSSLRVGARAQTAATCSR